MSRGAAEESFAAPRLLSFLLHLRQQNGY